MATKNKKHDDESIAGDLLRGAREISKFLGITERQTFYYVQKKAIPVTRLGSLIVASKSVLRRHFSVPNEVS
jgi:hypothetical protein